MAKKIWNCTSFFSGVGGMDLGFLSTGNFSVVYANEKKEDAAKTYRLNFDIEPDVRDIAEIKPEEVPKADLYLAGFSHANDFRDGMFFELLRLANSNQPKILVLEAPGTVWNHYRGKTMNWIQEQLTGCGYPHTVCTIMNASEFGNLPQDRSVVYILAFREAENQKRFVLPEPIVRTRQMFDVIDRNAMVDEKYYYRPDTFSSAVYDCIMEHLSDEETAVYRWRKSGLRIETSGLLPEMPPSQGMGGHSVGVVRTKYGLRKLTPMECFLAQGFPASFRLPDDVIDAKLYQQAGESTCVPVAKRMAEAICRSICGDMSEPN